MIWKEFQKYINTLKKYCKFVKKNLNLAPIAAEYKEEVDAAIDSISEETYKKEFERIGRNYRKIFIKEASRNSANRKGKTYGGRKKKRRKTKKIQKGGVGFGAIVLYITLGGISLCYIGACMKEGGCCRPCNVLPGDDKYSQRSRERTIQYEKNRKEWRKQQQRDKIEKNIKRHTRTKSRERGSEISAVSVSTSSPIYDGGPDDEPGINITLGYKNKKPTREDEADMREAQQYAKDVSYYNQGDTHDGHLHAKYLAEMDKKYPDMSQRKPNGVKVLTGKEYTDEIRENQSRIAHDNAFLDGRKGGPFSGFGGRGN